jgi:hypothetical protein
MSLERIEKVFGNGNGVGFPVLFYNKEKGLEFCFRIKQS